MIQEGLNHANAGSALQPTRVRPPVAGPLGCIFSESDQLGRATLALPSTHRLPYYAKCIPAPLLVFPPAAGTITNPHSDSAETGPTSSKTSLTSSYRLLQHVMHIRHLLFPFEK